MHSWHDRIDSTAHGLPLTHHRNVLAWSLIHYSIVRWVYASILWLPILLLWRVANISIGLHDSVDELMAIGGGKIIHLMLSILLIFLNLSLNETLILRKTLANLLAASKRNILIGATWWDVFVSTRKSVVTAVGICLLGFDFNQVNLKGRKVRNCSDFVISLTWFERSYECPPKLLLFNICILLQI